MTKYKYGIIIVALVMFGGMCVMENTAQHNRPITSLDANSSSIYALAGEFRVVFANLMWMKVEQYHHEYIAKHPQWTKNKDIMGMLTLITSLDPTFEEAYSSGTLIYLQGYKNPKKASSYLAEGLKNNPKSYELNRTAALMYGYSFKNPKCALPYAQKALNFAKDDFDKNNSRNLIYAIERKIKTKKT